MSSRNVLGVVLAGGRSSRFGSDKAMALLDGRPLIDLAIERLSGMCRAVAVSGRDYRDIMRIDDLPAPDLGPLGAINGALSAGLAAGYDRILTAACDNVNLPDDLLEQLGGGSAVVARQPVIGVWEAQLAPRLNNWLMGGRSRAVMAWVDEVGARTVEMESPVTNINRPEDLSIFDGSLKR